MDAGKDCTGGWGGFWGCGGYGGVVVEWGLGRCENMINFGDEHIDAGV